MNETGSIAYRVLSAAVMILCFAIGGILFVSFFINILVPASMQPRVQAFPMNYWGYYMTGFAGTLLITWGACLTAAVRTPAAAHGVGTATAVGLVFNAVFRMLAWFSGEFAEVGNVPRIEAAIMLLLALGFIWLRPPALQAGWANQGRDRS
jgi:hypothetical protein